MCKGTGGTRAHIPVWVLTSASLLPHPPTPPPPAGEVNRAAAWSALVRAGEAFFAVDSDVAFAEDPLAMLAGYSADIVLSGRCLCICSV